MTDSRSVGEQPEDPLSTVRLKPGALHWREIEGQVVAINVASRAYLAVNDTGAALWPLLQDGTTPEDLTDTLVQQFEVDRGTAADDVGRLLEDLRARGLLVG